MAKHRQRQGRIPARDLILLVAAEGANESMKRLDDVLAQFNRRVVQFLELRDA